MQTLRGTLLTEVLSSRGFALSRGSHPRVCSGWLNYVLGTVRVARSTVVVYFSSCIELGPTSTVVRTKVLMRGMEIGLSS